MLEFTPSSPGRRRLSLRANCPKNMQKWRDSLLPSKSLQKKIIAAEASAPSEMHENSWCTRGVRLWSECCLLQWNCMKFSEIAVTSTTYERCPIVEWVLFAAMKLHEIQWNCCDEFNSDSAIACVEYVVRAVRTSILTVFLQCSAIEWHELNWSWLHELLEIEWMEFNSTYRKQTAWIWKLLFIFLKSYKGSMIFQF